MLLVFVNCVNDRQLHGLGDAELAACLLERRLFFGQRRHDLAELFGTDFKTGI